MKAIEIFEKVNKEEFAKELVKRHDHYYPTIEKALRHFDIFMKDAYDRPLEELSDKDKENGFILVAREFISDENIEPIKDENGKYFAPKIDFKIQPKYMIVDGIYLKELIEKRDILGLTCKELREKDLMPVITYGISLLPRHLVLNYEVLPTSIDRYGLTTIAVELFFEFTFYGLVSEQVEDESDKLSDATNEIDKAKEYAQEHNITIDQAFEELGMIKGATTIDELFEDLDDEEDLSPEEIEEQEKYKEIMEDAKTNETYMASLMDITYQFGDMNIKNDKDFFEEFIEKYKDSELLKRFM
jgi:hypothetical protein